MKLLRYATLYHLYKLPIVRILRIVFVLIMSAFIVETVWRGIFPKGPLFVLSIFFMIEIMYRYKILKTVPTVTVQKNTKDIYQSFTMQALDAFFFSPDIKEIIHNLLTSHAVHFLLFKANLSVQEISFNNLRKEDIAQKALEVVKALDGSFITQVDLISAIILLAEPQ